MKNVLNIRIYLLFTLLILLFVRCNNEESKDKSVLDVHWGKSRIDYYLDLNVDSTNSPHSLLATIYGNRTGALKTFIPVYKQNKINSSIDIRIRYKTDDCESLSMIVSSIGECEKINSIDTLQLITTNQWQDSTLNIKIDAHTLFLNISIATKGMKDKRGKIWISNFEHNFVPKSIFHNLIYKKKKEKIKFSRDDLLSWNDTNFGSLPFFNKKILAIGETTHGTKTLNDIAIAIMKERILKKQCKIILLEIPLEYSLYINRYVNNDPNFKWEYIAKNFENMLFSESFLSFIKWVRQYNQTVKGKVFFLGFDINSIEMKSRVDFFNFLYAYNSTKHIKNIDKICKDLILSKRHNTNRIGTIENIIKKFKSDKFLQFFTNEELILITQYLELTKQKYDTNSRFANRDKTMSKIMLHIINNLLKKNETITIFGHIGHLDYLSSQNLFETNYFSAGHYLKNQYRIDYSCIALLANQGKVMLSKTDKEIDIFDLQIAPTQSLEYQINSFNKDSVYLSIDDKFNCSDIFKIRQIGNVGIDKQFANFFIPKVHIDGVVFIKEATNINKSPKALKTIQLGTNSIVMNAYIDALNKVKDKKK